MTGAAPTTDGRVNVQNIPTPFLWLGGTVGGGTGPLPGILKEDETYLLDENGERILQEHDA